jgi:hypothetical protein
MKKYKLAVQKEDKFKSKLFKEHVFHRLMEENLFNKDKDNINKLEFFIEFKESKDKKNNHPIKFIYKDLLYDYKKKTPVKMYNDETLIRVKLLFKRAADNFYIANLTFNYTNEISLRMTLFETGLINVCECLEKIMKALILLEGIIPDKTHNLLELYHILKENMHKDNFVEMNEEFLSKMSLIYSKFRYRDGIVNLNNDIIINITNIRNIFFNIVKNYNNYLKTRDSKIKSLWDNFKFDNIEIYSSSFLIYETKLCFMFNKEINKNTKVQIEHFYITDVKNNLIHSGLEYNNKDVYTYQEVKNYAKFKNKQSLLILINGDLYNK